jgi:hypothetical protein
MERETEAKLLEKQGKKTYFGILRPRWQAGTYE